jgi:hypothetical protein
MITSKEVIISVSKTISKKILYVVVALAMLAMMIPMAIPVSAAGGTIAMYLVDPITHTSTVLDGGYNISGSTVRVTVSGDTVASWAKTDWVSGTNSDWDPATYPGAVQTVYVNGVWGESTIVAKAVDNTTYSVDKKWGQITNTVITPPGSSYVTWNEGNKTWSAGPVVITDTVNGIFKQKDGQVTHVVQGAILNWYLVPGNVMVSTAAGEAPALKAYIAGLQATGPIHVSFAPWALPQNPPVPALPPVKTAVNVTGALGTATASLYANGEEAVQVVVIPEYPNDPQIDVIPEVTSWDFFTTEMEVVPQVRWAGEKIVLEKYFGTAYNGRWVKFALQNQSVGALEGIAGLNNTLNGGTVWTQVANGFASCILVSSDAGVSNVTAGLYSGVEGTLLDNQHFFTVYFLKFESITLGDVQGKRTMHSAGPWEIIPAVGNAASVTNPWDPTGSYNGTRNPAVPDNATQTLNISQDALLRAQVKGWFTSSNPSVRPVRTIDPANSTLTDPTTATLTLPAGRWILPDDWAALAGPNWQQSRMHWDIMCNPDGSVLSINDTTPQYTATVGNFLKGAVVVGARPVVGPFSPGLELMTPAGWTIPNLKWDSLRSFGGVGIDTVVPDGKLNWWDAPMPSAKIIFQIQNPADVVTTNGNVSAQNGYFKATNKGDVYFVQGTVGAPTYSDRKYTNPFYYAFIPAHEAIPPFINNGGYDWDSFDPSYGPYMFWQFINQNKVTPILASADPSGHPTAVEVYSDNHGEAMVWLNGNWNNDLNRWLYQADTANIPYGTIVGYSTIQATADYPYSRLHQAVQSNMDTKTWTWGQQVLGPDSHNYSGLPVVPYNMAQTRMVLSIGDYDKGAAIIGSGDSSASTSLDKMVFVWLTDRDGTRAGVMDAKITWTLGTIQGTDALIAADTGRGLSGWNDVTKNLYLDNGFLATGVPIPGIAAITNTTIPMGPGLSYGAAADRRSGTSTVIVPDSYLTSLFNKFWGPTGTTTLRANVNGYVVAGIKISATNGSADIASVKIDISSKDFNLNWNQTTTGMVTYRTVVDFSHADALDDGIREGDANCDGQVNMGDVTAVERMILGYDKVTSNSVMNNDGTVDMGTVVKIERNILGYK